MALYPMLDLFATGIAASFSVSTSAFLKSSLTSTLSGYLLPLTGLGVGGAVVVVAGVAVVAVPVGVGVVGVVVVVVEGDVGEAHTLSAPPPAQPPHTSPP